MAASRFASGVRASPEGCRVALIGLPDDLGVRMNGGRPGASEGPTAFRSALARYGVREPSGWVWPGVYDAGDVVPAGGDSPDALAETHGRVTLAVEAALDMGLFPIGVGGGHDLTFAFVRPVAIRYPGLVGYYMDAHLDVRDSIGSGMPFRRLIEECGVQSLRLVGMNPMANASEHLEYFSEKRGRLMDCAEFEASAREEPLNAFASLDLDVIDGAHAPGVSAVHPCGMVPRDIERLVETLGRSRRIRCFDIMELNPRFDHDGRTARLAAHLFLVFMRGLAERWGDLGRDEGAGAWSRGESEGRR
ncbi:MAG: formimidoylglutamase [Phycisphaeraceae bacterium]|nr:formimidoylglutamase [Phycisphaeraceae bacterium]